MGPFASPRIPSSWHCTGHKWSLKGQWCPGILLRLVIFCELGTAIWDVGGVVLSNWILGKETKCYFFLFLFLKLCCETSGDMSMGAFPLVRGRAQLTHSPAKMTSRLCPTASVPGLISAPLKGSLCPTCLMAHALGWNKLRGAKTSKTQVPPPTPYKRQPATATQQTEAASPLCFLGIPSLLLIGHYSK